MADIGGNERNILEDALQLIQNCSKVIMLTYYTIKYQMHSQSEVLWETKWSEAEERGEMYQRTRYSHPEISDLTTDK